MSEEREFLKKLRYASLLENDLRKELDELLAQPEQSSTTRHALDSYWNQEAYQRGYAQAVRDLKREPLSDEDVFKLYEEAEYLGFITYRKGIKDAEKMHGIGGGE